MLWMLHVSDLASQTWASSHMMMSHKITDAVPQQWEVSIGNFYFFRFYFFLDNAP